jgi:hypothetical protein
LFFSSAQDCPGTEALCAALALRLQWLLRMLDQDVVALDWRGDRLNSLITACQQTHTVGNKVRATLALSRSTAPQERREETVEGGLRCYSPHWAVFTALGKVCIMAELVKHAPPLTTKKPATSTHHQRISDHKM